VQLSTVGQAVGMFAVTNVDDIILLALFFGQATGRRQAQRVVAGQYLGFAAILVVSVAGAVGASLLPESAIAYLGLIPLGLGVRAGWVAWADRRDRHGGAAQAAPLTSPGALSVAAITFANGGDNLGVYIPVFATTDVGGMLTYCVVFLVMVGVWCGLGRYLATRRPVAEALARWGHIVLPVVLVGIGLAILVEGGAFGW
jgi:cadmium resistance protein CadD (predicted permease)